MNASKTLDIFEQRRNRALNTIHTWLLGAGSLLLLAATAWALAGRTGIVYAIVFGAVSMWLVRRVSPQMVLQMYKARAVSRAEFPAGHDIVETLAARAGLPSVPKLHVVPSKLLNAFAVGRPEESALAITDQLARTLTGRELAGVLAHEISHIAHGDLKVMAFADMVSRFTSLFSTFGFVGLFFNLFGMAGGQAAMVPWPAVLLLVAAPSIGGLLQTALSRTREFDADLGAAMLTGDPEGLASALRKLEKAQGAYWESMMLPGSRLPVPSVLRTHPATEDRVARLMALKGAGPTPPEFDDGSVTTPRMPTRPSLVPGIRAGRGLDHAAFMALPVQPPVSADETPLRTEPMLPSEGKPRIRVLRGGIYF
ncbi:MAG: zinc metalloprotease HtpX [Mesorhizobium sp.]|nr:zinc metalloprotease HtpX [Mesorhizobium sp.]